MILAKLLKQRVQRHDGTIERWRDVPNYEGYYRVSDLGRVKSVTRIVRHNCGGPKRVKGQMKKIRVVDAGGHLGLFLYKNGKRKHFFVHTLVLIAFVGPCPKNMECRHLDGDPTNNRLDNIKWDTPKNNQQDRFIHGTHMVGGKNKNACFTNEEAEKIRDMWKSRQFTKQEIADIHNVSRYTIYRIINQDSYYLT